MKLKLILLTLSIFSLFSCSSDDDSTNKVNIRLTNKSELKFKDATYNGINFGDIEPGEKTEYQLFKNEYFCGSVNITINEEEYGWQLIDFIKSASPPENGNYTFEYRFDETDKVLTDKLVKD